MKASEIIAALNQMGGRNGIGLYDVVENRLVGMKSRGVYETPGGTILYHAHQVLETLTLDKPTAHKKRELAITFGELVYDGQWFSPLRKALLGLCHRDPAARHRQGAAETVQGQHLQRRGLVSLLPLQPGDRHL